MVEVLPQPPPLVYQEDYSLIDPVTNFRNIPGLVDLKQKDQIFEDQKEQKKILEKQCKKQEDKKWYQGWLAQGILAIVSSGLTVILLYVFNPPMTQQKRRDDYTSEKQSVLKVIAVCFFVFLLVLLLPECIRLVNSFFYKKKQNK